MTVAPWLQFVLENPNPLLPCGTIVMAEGNVAGEIVGHRAPRHPRGHWAYQVASAMHDFEIRYVFPEEILSAERPTFQPDLREVMAV